MSPECPNCREPIPRLRLFATSAWGRWNCRSCGALLGLDTRRRLLAVVSWIVILILLIYVARIANFGYAIAAPLAACAAILNFFLFDRAVVHERTGFRCHGCGYDLQGQVAARCPECGLEFEAAALATYQAHGEERKRAARRTMARITLAFLIGSLFVATIMTVVYTRAAQRRAARTLIATSQTATQAAAESPSAMGLLKDDEDGAEPKSP